MRTTFFILFSLTLISGRCQTGQSDSVSQCIFENSPKGQLQSPKAILVTPIFEKEGKGIYAFRIKGPHSFNRLAFRESGSCRIIPNDSTSQFLKDEVSRFAERNKLSKKQIKQVEKKIKDYILDFKDSEYLN